jgi:hypothetical protein
MLVAVARRKDFATAAKTKLRLEAGRRASTASLVFCLKASRQFDRQFRHYLKTPRPPCRRFSESLRRTAWQITVGVLLRLSNDLDLS